MRTIFAIALALCLASCVMAFAPTSLPALRTVPRAQACSTGLRMSATEDDGEKDLKSGNDPISILLDSVKRLFKKSEDDYPPGDGQGFTQTPKKPTRNKGEW
mmetsp:Transcript_64839/g.135183  ORF Transcript_64839/g.135183 Transcript_64839/m.135183 type:complete len:102 (+) Transcript_64839:126-431(+)|eukprot:CAMPEP_0181346750 /NCGR_PEP_ID=MMETSP1101-20121128/33498_1 /TAXON_ID=46948 /ORGANISM="Rhodomonas abbreviata, Strain Caron Lab Isolate" /LENGTH=101 /DNA_ID=CAMNT_0023458891 /DNA_START=126 /DNA_END=428 /DNA_ORIENTATION=-